MMAPSLMFPSYSYAYAAAAMLLFLVAPESSMAYAPPLSSPAPSRPRSHRWRWASFRGGATCDEIVGRFFLGTGRRCDHSDRTRSIVSDVRGGALAASSGGNGDGGDGGGRRRMLLGTLGTLLALPLAAEAYSRAGMFGFPPREDDSRDILFQKGWEKVEHATVVFHGAGGQDQYTDELMSNIRKQRLVGENEDDGARSLEAIVDWYDGSRNVLQSSFNGQRRGRRIASRLFGDGDAAPPPSLRTLHVIGISVGAFAADAFVTEWKKQWSRYSTSPPALGAGEPGVFVQLTLLDPFCQRGILDPWYGERNFGKSADYAQQFLNTDDPVPRTDKPLPWCACIDVTKLRPEGIFGHDWPLVYYARSGRVILVAEADRRPRGDVIFATE